MQLERGFNIWTETASSVALEVWPNEIPESGGICLYEGRLKELAQEIQKEKMIAAVIGSVPRPNQAFWTLSALWAGWLWGPEAVEPYKLALRRRRYDWAWNATALHAAFTHLYELLPAGTPFFGLLAEPEAPFLTAALTAASAAGFKLESLALRTEHDPIQILWKRAEHLKRDTNEAKLKVVQDAVHVHLTERGEPASYLHLHAAGLLALTEAQALTQPHQEFDEALRKTNACIQNALSSDARFMHYSTGDNVDTGLWGLPFSPRHEIKESLSDRVEVAIVTFLQKNAESIYLEIEQDLYPRFPGLLTPSKAMIYSVLNSYAEKHGALWKLRAEDLAAARRNELNIITAMIAAVGKRLGIPRAGRIKIIYGKNKRRSSVPFISWPPH